MNGEQIIQKFYRQIDDSSELSTDEALSLMNDVYGEICDDRPWLWLQSSGEDVIADNAFTLPSDFKEFSPNLSGNYGDYHNLGTVNGYQYPMYNPSALYSVVFVGENQTPYRVIPREQIRNYRNVRGFCFINNGVIEFTSAMDEGTSVLFDYIKIAPDIALDTEPLFRSGFHNILAYGMARDYDVIVQTDKNMSYRRENQDMFFSSLQQLQIEDANNKLTYQ